MKQDHYGQIIFSANDICDAYMRNQNSRLRDCLIEEDIQFDEILELDHIPNLIKYATSNLSMEQFDLQNQQVWNMPNDYKNLDIAKWILDQCNTDVERQRVGEELLLYLERDLFPLLQYLKYLVDTMRKYNIVWGVGRGSSVSSYVLYLIGIHKINSIYYDLDISEFLK